MYRLEKHFGDHSQLIKDKENRQRWFIRARHEKLRKEDIADKMEEELFSVVASAAIATTQQILQFQSKLTSYEDATVAALMKNQKMLDVVLDDMEVMLAHAYVMDDGRRVFKSVDGETVIDEFGEIVSRDELDPKLIPSGGTTPDEYLSNLELAGSLRIERNELHAFQDKLDNARDASSKDDLTNDELDALDADLEASMPKSVQAQLPDYEPAAAANIPNIRNSFSKNALPAAPENFVRSNLPTQMPGLL